MILYYQENQVVLLLNIKMALLFLVILVHQAIIQGKKYNRNNEYYASCTTEGEATINLTTHDTTTVSLDDGAVKYAVYNGQTLVNEGTITGSTQALATVDLTKTATTYTVYVWLDGNITDNTYIGKSYSGQISVSAIQTES